MARKSIYSDFRNFNKTYSVYKRNYYRKARQIYKKQHGLKAKSRLPKSVTKADLRNVMRDDEILSRRDFAETYRSYKRDLLENDSSADPTQYIVRDQAYEFSAKQYRGFKKAVATAGFDEEYARELENISMMEFMTGEWRTEEFFDRVKMAYQQAKIKAQQEGRTDKDIWLYAQKEVANLYFGSEPSKRGWK